MNVVKFPFSYHNIYRKKRIAMSVFFTLSCSSILYCDYCGFTLGYCRMTLLENSTWSYFYCTLIGGYTIFITQAVTSTIFPLPCFNEYYNLHSCIQSHQQCNANVQSQFY